MSTVRGQLVAAIHSAVGALPWVGAVVPAGSMGEAQFALLTTGVCVAEVYAAEDQAVDAPGGAERLRMGVAVIVHLPAQIPEEGDPPGVPSAEEYAADRCADLYTLYEAGGANDGTWGGQALGTTLVQFCTGLAVTDRGTRVVGHAFEVVYGFRRGDPTTAA